MKLEDQVNNRELGEILKKLGVRQESAFYWNWTGEPGQFELELKDQDTYPDSDVSISAFTCSELGEMLPDNYISGRNGEIWSCCKWTPELIRTGSDFVTSDTEANARAKMLIYLIEQGIINAKTV